MREHWKEEVWQAFLDGELSSEKTERVATHIAGCAACQQSLREAEREMRMLSEALAVDVSVSVPTEALRQRLNRAVAATKPLIKPSIEPLAVTRIKPGVENSLSALMRDLLTAPLGLVSGRGAAASHGLAIVIAVVLTAAVILMIAGSQRLSPINSTRQQSPVAGASPSIAERAALREEKSGEEKLGQETLALQRLESRSTASPRDRDNESSARTRLGQRKLAASTVRGRTRVSSREREDAAGETELLPGEESYLKAIEALARTIETPDHRGDRPGGGGDDPLAPSVRLAYRKNLQVVDSAIAETRCAARQNPDDTDAADFLLSAYQSKLDLLTAITTQAQYEGSAP